MSFLIVAMLLSGWRQAGAIAVENLTIAEARPEAEGYTLNWDYIYRFRDSSSVAVDHYWLLTAAHVADDTASGVIEIEGQAYTPQETVYHETADLALVRFDKPFPGYYLLHEGDIFHTEGKGNNKTTVYEELVLVGYGRTGMVTQTTFQNGPGGAGKKRWGTNESSGLEQTVNTDAGGTAGVVSSLCFHMDFNTNNTLFEAGAAQFDSGGPAMIEADGQWKVAGINAYLSGAYPNYDGNFSVKISAYTSWITNNIPDYDTDMDGLPDHWEVLYGSMEAEGDPDLDGFSNYQEWIADTVPTNTESFPFIEEWQAPTNVIFSTSADRSYSIEYRERLADTNESWSIEENWFVGSGGQVSKVVSNLSSNRFYRIRVKVR